MSRTRRLDPDGLAGVTYGCGPGSLDLCFMSARQMVTTSSKSSVAQTARYETISVDAGHNQSATAEHAAPVRLIGGRQASKNDADLRIDEINQPVCIVAFKNCFAQGIGVRG